MKKIDFRKELKTFYNASAKNVEIVEVPPMNFLMIDGEGDPNTSQAFRDAVEALFSLSYALKFALKKGPEAVDYGVMPLEGLWWADDMTAFARGKKEDWKWTAMIMQPAPVTESHVENAVEAVGKKKALPALRRVRFESFSEGKSAQTMNIGPFSEEGPTIEKVHEAIRLAGFAPAGKHHEIYLSDTRRSPPEKWKTIIRQPMKP